MAGLKYLWKFLFSPQLYKVYANSRCQGLYEPNSLERWGDQVINSLTLIWNLGLYTSPVIGTVLYKMGYVGIELFALVVKVLIGHGLILSSSYCIRGLGRTNNPAYVTFYEVLLAAEKSMNNETKKALMAYDFEFSAWPVEFTWSDVEGDGSKPRISLNGTSEQGGTLDSIFSLPCRALSYVVAHTFGIKMVYPGSVRTLQYFMFDVILQGRTKLVEENFAKRFKIRTRDDNDIDTIFIDKRDRDGDGLLVICCEGNAGFYEIGIAMTPIEAGHSVLGWNHPGFGGSTGTPYPLQEQNAIDCVMQFAINYLRFKPQNILLFGWSIGGYTASWAAMNYPDIRGLILDATFDDLLPLAVIRMPSSWTPLVRRTIRSYINLNIVDQVCKFDGPVTFIRRTKDEIICTERDNLASNRGNHLVAKFLGHRYPNLMDWKRKTLLNEWLALKEDEQSLLMERHQVDKDLCNSLLSSYIEDNSSSYPMHIGDNLTTEIKDQMLLFLVDTYLKNFRSSHGVALPERMFRLPWRPTTTESSFVKL